MATAAKEIPFTWEGVDRRGQRVKGKVIATSEAEVRADLRRQGVVPNRIRKQSQLFAGTQKITTADIAIFSRQLATMMAAGIPLVQAFEIVGNGHENQSMQKLILDIKADVEGGSALHEALAKHPLYFDDLFVNLVEAGEQAGALETLLDKIATYQEKTEAIKKKIKKALTYPIAVLVVAVIVTIILLIFVIPAFEDLFTGFGADLPAFTRMVVDLSQFVRTQGWMLLLGFGAGALGLGALHDLEAPAGRRQPAQHAAEAHHAHRAAALRGRDPRAWKERRDGGSHHVHAYR